MQNLTGKPKGTSADETIDAANQETIGYVRFAKPQPFGDYDLTAELARGGMGRVFEARHRKLGRVVALKRILPGQVGSQSAVDRFLSEFRAAAQLDHPGIVPVFDVGEVDGEHFFTMALMPGPRLQDVLKTGPLECRQAATHVEQIARAVEYAHDHGIVHRDLKPSNILLDNDNRPRITDFGLAKTAGRPDHTVAGQVLGSPNYMAPEQANGVVDQIAPTTDVYGLGALLYGLITGRPPFQAASLPETLRQVAESEPLRPRELDDSIPQDLEVIALKAIEKQPARRYATAAQLADDLRRFLDNRPIFARPAPPLERAFRWSWRNKFVAVMVATLAVATIGLFASASLVVHQRRIAEANLSEANQQQAVAEANFGVAVGAVDEFFTQVSEDTLLNEPGMRPLRKSLLESARRFYDELATNGQATGASQELRVEAIAKQARIVELIDSTAEARELFQQAISEIQMMEGYHDDANWLTKLGHCESQLAAVTIDMGELDTALEILQSGREHLKQALRLAPHRVDARVYEAILLRRMADLYSKQGNMESCLTVADASEKSLSGLAVKDVTWAARIQRQLGMALRTSGVIRLLLGQHEEAIQKFDEAILHYSEIDDPNATTETKWLAADLQTLKAKCLARTNRQEAAAKVIAPAIVALSELSDQFPLTVRFTTALAKAHQQLGSIYWNQYDFVAARDSYELALEAFRQLAAKRPEVVSHQVSISRALQNIGIACEYMDEHPSAEEHYREAVQTLAAVIETHPDQAKLRTDLIRLQANLGTSRMNQGRWDEAEASLSAAMDMARRCLEAQPALPEAAIAVGEVAMALGNCFRWTGRESESLALFDEGIACVENALAPLDAHVSLTRSAHSCWFGKGQALYQVRDWDEADDAFQHSLEYVSGDYDRFVVNTFMQMIAAHRRDCTRVAEFLETASKMSIEAVELHRTRAFVLASCYQGAFEDETLEPTKRLTLLQDYRTESLKALRQLESAGGLKSLTEQLEIKLFPAFDQLRNEAELIGIDEP